MCATHERWSFGTINSKALVHDGNKLRVVHDAAEDIVYYNDANDFRNGANEEYSYDANSNMTMNISKVMTNSEYNYRNLPVRITFADEHVTEYVYDTAGTKRSVIYKVQPETLFAPVENKVEGGTAAEPLVVSSRKDYYNSHIYNSDGNLMTVITENGYIEGGTYHFFVRD